MKPVILLVDESEKIYSWLCIELSDLFVLEHIQCPVHAYTLAISTEFHAIIIDESKSNHLISRYDEIHSPLFILSDERNLLNIYRFQSLGVSGFYLKSEPFQSLKTALLNPFLQKFWMSDQTKLLMSMFPKESRFTDLTCREKEVFIMLADGVGYKEIAFQLGIRAKTVLSHRARIMRKMCIKTNSELIKEAIRIGVISLA